MTDEQIIAMAEAHAESLGDDIDSMRPSERVVDDDLS